MEKILVLDERNYDDNLREIFRIAVRGIIFVEGRLLMTESSFGEVKLPGGRPGTNVNISRCCL